MSPAGRYFFIKSKGNGYVLDVKEGSLEPGAHVHTWKNLENENQIWYRDPFTGTLRNRHSNLCLDIGPDRQIIVNKYDPKDPNQQWRYDKSRETIHLADNPVMVLDVAEASSSMGSKVIAYEYHGKSNQEWKLVPHKIDYFVIKSAQNGKVFDIARGKSSAGTPVIVYERHSKNKDNQLWYEDAYANLRSKLTDKYVLDASGGSVVLGNYEDGNRDVYWIMSGNKIINKYNPDVVLEVKSNDEIGAGQYRGAANQHWVFERV